MKQKITIFIFHTRSLLNIHIRLRMAQRGWLGYYYEILCVTGKEKAQVSGSAA